MPLLPGKKNIGYNITEMEKAGHPKNQSVAAALHKAYDKSKKGEYKPKQKPTKKKD
jgi:hypothetical protein